tara:strand:- start:50 stop:1432 length:1383 start_codon:yes stop_codon:yes gene_type:complete
MRKLIQTIKNIWKIEDLRTRILITLAFIAIYRFGSFVVLPGIDATVLSQANENSGGPTGLLALLNMFTGGAFAQASIFALGIMPYISASIVIQLLGMAIPYFQKLQREGESGRRKINNITRYLTILIVGGQAPGFIANLKATWLNVAVNMPDGSISYVFPNNEVAASFWIMSVIILITGTLFVMWLGEKITDRGVGNGISLLIMIGIIALLPMSLVQEFTSSTINNQGGLVKFVLEMVILVVVIGLCILLVQGTRRIPVQYAKRIVGNKQYGGVRQFIPLKVNASGVMPIIFAQAIMFIPMTLAGFSDSEELGAVTQALSDFAGFWYNALFFVMVVIFTYFYTAITVNPKQMADDMKKNGGFIPGIKPGRKTAEYLDSVMSRITFPGSLFLGFVAILPAFAMQAGVNPQFAQFFGGTSLLIIVGVVLDTLQQIESHLLMRHYDGLMEKGKIKGKSSGSMM